MLSKCANPACATPFQYLREGRLYQFEISGTREGSLPKDGRKPVRRVEHFWLCGRCAATMKLALENHQKVVVLPIRSAGKTRHAAAS